MKTLRIAAFLLIQIGLTLRAPGLTFAASQPHEAKLTGRVTILKDVSSLPVTLVDPKGPAIQTETRADGSFHFARVSAGTYTLRVPRFIRVNVVVESKDVNVELSPLYSGPGAVVNGKVTFPSGTLKSERIRTVTL